jgi:hypothetical protein
VRDDLRDPAIRPTVSDMPPASPAGGVPAGLPLVVPCPRCGGRIVVVGRTVGGALRLTAGGACTDCGGTVYSALDLEETRR